MKSIKSLSVAAALFFASVTSYAGDITKMPDVRNEVTSVLSKSDLKADKFVINFLINANGEMVVVSTTSKESENTIKNLLNYRKVDATNYDINKIYTLPVTIEKK